MDWMQDSVLQGSGVNQHNVNVVNASKSKHRNINNPYGASMQRYDQTEKNIFVQTPYLCISQKCYIMMCFSQCGN